MQKQFPAGVTDQKKYEIEEKTKKILQQTIYYGRLI